MLPEQAAAMTALGAPRFAVLVRIDCVSEPVTVWSGVGDLEDEGRTYLGLGILGEIPGLRQLIGGTAERLDFTLSVPDGPYFELADSEVDEVKGAAVQMGLVFFDDAWQAVAPAAWLWDGTADVPSVSRTSNGGQVQRAITLSVGSTFTDRTRPALTYYTDADQKLRSPDDRFCERVPLYTGSSTIKWPA